MNQYYLRFRIYLFDLINLLLSLFGLSLVTNNYINRRYIFNQIRIIKKELNLLMTVQEGFQLYSFAKAALMIPGMYGEVGVYRGASAKIICLAKGKRILHLFDTFTGLPNVQKIDSFFQKGQYCNTLSETKNNLFDCSNVVFHKGTFPSTGKSVSSCRFAFLHIDVDTYQSTFDVLKYFYPRMNKGGIILGHDYPHAGVYKAYNDYFRNKRVLIIELTGVQCLVIKQ